MRLLETVADTAHRTHEAYRRNGPSDEARHGKLSIHTVRFHLTNIARRHRCVRDTARGAKTLQRRVQGTRQERVTRLRRQLIEMTQVFPTVFRQYSHAFTQTNEVLVYQGALFVSEMALTHHDDESPEGKHEADFLFVVFGNDRKSTLRHIVRIGFHRFGLHGQRHFCVWTQVRRIETVHHHENGDEREGFEEEMAATARCLHGFACGGQ